ncbi:MAG: TonB-dependent receptor, partial [Calditrichaeota bacterium]|nr:TonB-dependent receptor [Calditrichota bacterium]
KFETDGVVLDEERSMSAFAIDFNTTISFTETYIVGEMVFINVDVPQTYTQQYGNKQKGYFVDVVQPILKRKILDWEKATFNIAARVDYIDWNVGTFTQTNSNIGDHLFAITPAVSFRPTQQTVFRLNYRRQWQTDILENPAAQKASWYFGFSTYF